MSTSKRRVRRMAFVCAAGALGACGPDFVLRGDPEPVELEAARDAPATAVVMPAVGEVRATTLADGWPVWVVGHIDGRVTVVSAVARRTRSATTLFAGAGALVRWLPWRRELLADDIAYEEHGRVMSYVVGDDCGAECPRESEPARDEQDLDTFETRRESDLLIIGALVPAPPGPEPAWNAYDEPPHADREIDVPPADVRMPAAPPRSIADALAAPVGSYAIVTGSIVQSTARAPRLCADGAACAMCDASSPEIFGVAGVPVSQAARHAESGTLLVRREPGGLAVIATSRVGACRR